MYIYNTVNTLTVYTYKGFNLVKYFLENYLMIRLLVIYENKKGWTYKDPPLYYDDKNPLIPLCLISPLPHGIEDRLSKFQ